MARNLGDILLTVMENLAPLISLANWMDFPSLSQQPGHI